ncbi:hypothetical protein [Chamaesiphon minutus]|uniref:Macrodomain effector MavL domain-containing protein n=1 Tax=Chamaesiphon minutus (strain ATCC 27169 / PCC 6605) TaxID=1173020 RepID=K9UF38_CHAP6|nr:hypothetical protein [Chamaesiphon minutus]AFY93737.1 hypothetical protein Cha6605_2695 [Chamaesiphon minutus PCC 6605]
MKHYTTLANPQTYQKAIAYLDRLKAGEKAGEYLHHKLKNIALDLVTIPEFIELLMQTKRPQIFAESAVFGNGIDWNQAELSILGDLSIVTPVTVYDNGKHRHPDVHESPFAATLIFTPGALLRNDNQITPVDWDEVTTNGKMNSEGYYRLYERRLLPAFLYINELATQQGKKALITIPGMGCGQFAGIFRGQLGTELKQTLINFLQAHASKFSQIQAVYYDPYSECDNDRIEIEGISLFVRPLLKGNTNKPQLCLPQTYAEDGDNFDNCELFSFVAWDHVSWPGNDFYLNARSTDDGVKAAATNVMQVMTGIEGTYNSQLDRYCQPREYETWKEVVSKNKIQLHTNYNLIVLPSTDR